MTQVQTQEEAKKVVLSDVETSEIEQTFAEATDFRSIWEKITAPIDSIVSETAAIIDKDPIMNISGELSEMNNEVQWVYKDILNTDSAIMKLFKGMPWIWSIVTAIDWKIGEAKFNMKTVEWKIGVIFSGFDQSYESINTSIYMQKKFLDGIDANLGKVVAYKDFLSGKVTEMKAKAEAVTDAEQKQKLTLFIQNVEFFQNNLVVLIGNLEMAKKRLLMRLDSANKLSLAMNSSRPIFKTLLSTALIETSSQKAIDASMKAMDIMGQTIDKMSSELTDKAIEWSKRAEKMASKPVVSTKVFAENVEKLKKHFDELEVIRKEVAIEAEKERKEFEVAKNKLDQVKLLSKEETEEQNKELMG